MVDGGMYDAVDPAVTRNVILLGAPGSGKGTQGAILAEKLQTPKIATGDLLRAAVRDGTPLGKKAKAFMDEGLLVPDAIIIGLIEEVLESPSARHGVIMDGFPRTVAQAEAVDRALSDRAMQVDHVLTFKVDEGELVRRMAGRAAAEKRSDDTEEAFRKRLEVYEEQTAPLIDYYRERDIVTELDGMGTVDEIAEQVGRAVGL